ncbi:MAG TPA: arginine repressor [Clostridia bacterium]|nr:arginine repressor [Clostridia bacterium]
MKAARQRKIIDIINKQVICTQEELVKALEKEGYKVTQATISRDIKELGLVKVPNNENSHLYQYALPAETRTSNPLARLHKVFRDSVVKVDYSENIIVIRTLTGNAHAVAACLDYMEWEEVLGTVAGDDTIIVIVKPKGAVKKVYEMLVNLLE